MLLHQLFYLLGRHVVSSSPYALVERTDLKGGRLTLQGNHLINGLILHHSHPDAQRYLGFFFPRMPPVFPETDFCTAPFATLPATLPTSGTKVGFAVVP